MVFVIHEMTHTYNDVLCVTCGTPAIQVVEFQGAFIPVCAEHGPPDGGINNSWITFPASLPFLDDIIIYMN